MTKAKFAKIAGGVALGTVLAGMPGMITGLFITLGIEGVEKIKNCIETNAKLKTGDIE